MIIKRLKQNQLLRDTLSTKNWIVSIRRKFWKIVPFNTTYIILLTIFSQLTFMVAFLLPIKIIMFLGSGRIPKYIPEPIAQVEYNTLILILSSCVVLFYALHSISEKIITLYVEKGTKKLLAHTNKSSLFENQEQVALNAYMKFSKALAGFIFVFLVMLGLGFIYTKLFVFIVFYILVGICLIFCTVALSQKFFVYLKNKTNIVLNTFANIGFFAVFLFMVYDILFTGAKLNFLVIIISVILSRQLLSQLTGSILNLKAIYTHRIKINALFYHGHTLNHTMVTSKNSFWDMLEKKEQLEKTIQIILCDVLEIENSNFTYEWFDIRINNLAVFIVKTEENKKYLLQIFNTNQSSLAKHQLSFLEYEKSKLHLDLKGAVELEKCHCHLFELDTETMVLAKKFKEENYSFLSSLIGLIPKEETTQLYKKSKPLLTKRIQPYMIDRVSIATRKVIENEALIYFKKNLSDILKYIETLPLQYINPNLSTNLLKKDEKILACFWGRWSIEPIGASFPIGRLNDLEKEYEIFKKNRTDLEKIGFESIALVAYLSEFERLSNRMLYTQALKPMQKVVEYYKKSMNNDTKNT